MYLYLLFHHKLRVIINIELLQFKASIFKSKYKLKLLKIKVINFIYLYLYLLKLMTSTVI